MIEENKQQTNIRMPPRPPPLDYAVEMEQLRVQLDELRQQQTLNTLLKQHIQKLDRGKKGRI